MNNKSSISVSEIILHNNFGDPVARLSFAGCHDTPPQIESTNGICLFLNHTFNKNTRTQKGDWVHAGTIGLDKDGKLWIGITDWKTEEHLVVNFETLKQLLNIERNTNLNTLI